MPEKRYAAGRARALGLPTRGTTSPNRLRRVDRHVVAVHGTLLRSAADPLVVDLGYGARATTTVELHARLVAVQPRVEVVGVEIEQERVDAAQDEARPGLRFVRGGFELAGLRPLLVRCLNVLRQYQQEQAAEAWDTVCAQLQEGGVLVEGTCDEIGRRAAWVTLDRSGPRTLTLAAHLPSLDRPSSLAERLPKSLIHQNVPGRPVHELLRALDSAWDRAAPYATYGPRQRWVEACASLPWEQVGPQRHREGELTVPWSTVDGVRA
ncbi:MAG TPA: class I SAM-dependent methyltransferase [Mycobacteriales bacterium]|nr:class I SAM-dependent methyltransferase [Mycobacteriales bacterium]